MTAPWSLRFGACLTDAGVEFRLWAPRLPAVQLIVLEDPPRAVPMRCEQAGEFAAFVKDLRAGAEYMFLTGDGRRRPDPVSRWQPHGVHGPSRVVDPAAFRWSDQGWKGIPLEDYLFYELHTGTFTPEGLFQSIVPRLPELRQLGVTAIEIMPVAEFPGRRNWGYDGVALYAPHSTYGGPEGLKTLVDACHQHGLAVVLDVVYNHLGPEGNYLSEFAPFFTDSYRTPWGQAINYDGADSDGVRRFFIDNALYWLTEYHIDALRLDAVHGIFDFSAHHILQELAERFHTESRRLGRSAWVIAESDLNDPRIIRPPESGGYGLDAQWNDDFHHSLHTALTRDDRGYFMDFDGLPSLGKALTHGFVYEGQQSRYRKRRHGSSSADRPGEQFVVFTQNHDQVANALAGCRASKLFSPEQQKLAAALLLCSPFLPLLFMGQEYGETACFYYFTDFGDPVLAHAVREGRRREAGAFLSEGAFVDPQDASTLERSKLNWSLRAANPHAGLLAWYRDLISFRNQCVCLHNGRKDLVRLDANPLGWLVMERSDPSGSRALLVCNFSCAAQPVPLPVQKRQWSRQLWSGAEPYGGTSAEPDVSITAGPGACLQLEGSTAVLYT